MTRVSRSVDCGNSPKNRLVEDVVVALEVLDVDFLLGILDSNAVWAFAGGRAVSAQTILSRLSTMKAPTALTIDRVMSHGKVGAVNGIAKHGKDVQRFCHVIEFTSAKFTRVGRIESYRG